MHMSDALISTPVAVATGIAAIGLIVVAGREIRKNNSNNDKLPLMGVMGAFVFAAQMINFAIPGTGSSGHIVGGVLLATLLGPWAAFLTLVSVLVIQCIVFADGGLLALGCNTLNMAAATTLIAYPFIFKPLIKFPASRMHIFGVSILACVVGLELGALGVTAETEASGITALPAAGFLSLMTAIHLAIGIGEGLATGAVICFIQASRPSLLGINTEGKSENMSAKSMLTAILVCALVLGGVVAFFASSMPDGLEWSINKMTGSTDLPATTSLQHTTTAIINKTSLFPDYDNSLSGVIGLLIVLALAWGGGSLLTRKKTRGSKN